MLNMRRLANKKNLAEVIAKAEALKEKDYTPESFGVLTAALKKAQGVMADATLSEKDQAIVDNAQRELDAAVKALVKASSGTPGGNPSQGGTDAPTGDAWPVAGIGLLAIAAAGALLLAKKRR